MFLRQLLELNQARGAAVAVAVHTTTHVHGDDVVGGDEWRDPLLEDWRSARRGACVIPSPGRNRTARTLRAHLREHLHAPHRVCRI